MPKGVLGELLTLTPKDLMILESLKKRREDSERQMQVIMAFIRSADIVQIIKQTSQSSRLYRLCKHSDLDSVWDLYLEQYASQKNIFMQRQWGMHPLDLLKGHFLYCQAMLIGRDDFERKSEREELLNVAVELGSFHAIYERNEMDLCGLRRAAKFQIIIDRELEPIIKHAERARMHGSAGCWLLVETYYSISRYHKEATKNTMARQQALEAMVFNLRMGIELLDLTEIATRNAYNGDSFPKSNILGISSAEELYDELIREAESGQVDINRICLDAREMSQIYAQELYRGNLKSPTFSMSNT